MNSIIQMNVYKVVYREQLIQKNGAHKMSEIILLTLGWYDLFIQLKYVQNQRCNMMRAVREQSRLGSIGEWNQIRNRNICNCFVYKMCVLFEITR